MILQAVVGGFVLDELFGDPAWLPHPVVLMGRCISRLEKFLRARLPGTPQGELLGGAVTAFCLPVGTFLVTSLCVWRRQSSAVAGPCGADVLVRAGAGGKGPCAGEHKCVRSAY